MTGSGTTSSLAATVGRNIKARRKAAGLTQHDLAVALGRGDQMTVSRWERGEHKPSDDYLLLLADVLACVPADFYEIERSAA